MEPPKKHLANNTQETIIQFVKFKLESETYCVNVIKVQEVIRYTDIADVPGSPDYVIGIINLRGKIITILNTRKRFCLPESDINTNNRIIILETQKHVFGILVDSVAEVVYINSTEIDNAPMTGRKGSNKYVQGICNKGNDLLILIDVEKLLNEDELQDLDGFTS